MGFLASLFERRSHPSNPIKGFLDMFRVPTDAGVDLTVQGSLASTTVFACVRILSESVAALPLILYRRRADRGKDRATDHSLFSRLRLLPNPEMTSIELRETFMGHLLTWGNAYAEIEYTGGGDVLGLWPLRPDKVRVKRRNRRLTYIVTMPKGPEVGLPFERVMHIKGLGYDGMVGYSPIGMARQAVGLSLATEKYGAKYFGNGAKPGGVLEHPGAISDEAESRLRKSWEMMHQGLDNAQRVAILEEGMNYRAVGLAPEESQFLETRRFQVAEIARMYRVPLHMLAELERGTPRSNVEQMSLEFVIYSLMPWLVRIEQAISRDLLTSAERQELFAEHLVDGLLRGDLTSRYDAYGIGRQQGWLSVNDIRDFENMNPIDGGDDYLVPLNMTPADSERSQPEQRALPETRNQTGASRQRLAASYRRVIADSVGRVVRREIADLRRAVRKFFGKRTAEDFSLWMNDFYDDHREFWADQTRPIMRTYADQTGASVSDELGQDVGEIDAFVEEYVLALARREVGSSHGQLRALLDEALTTGEDPEEMITARLDEWEEKRTEKVALRESFLAMNAFATAFYSAAGVTKLVWTALGENCPYCNNLNGKVVGIQETYLDADTEFMPDGADRPIKVRHKVKHPPLHGGCDCVILAR